VRFPLGVAAVLGAMATSILLLTSPVMALVAAPLAFGLMDWGLSTALRVPGPRFVLRIFGRVVAAAAAGIVLRVLLSLATTPRAPSLLPWLLPALAILFSLAWSFAAIASNLVAVIPAPVSGSESERDRVGHPTRARPPLGEGALVMFADVVVASFAVMLSILVHGGEDGARPARVMMVACLALATTMCARGLLVASIAARLAARPTSPTRVVVAFVLWLGHAAIVTTLVKDPIAWSGLGTAVLLTIAAVLAEGRRPQPSALAALGRATIAWSVATTLSLLLLIGKA